MKEPANFQEWENQMLGRIRHAREILNSWHGDKYFSADGHRLRGEIDGLNDALRIAKVFNLHLLDASK